jgi:hypothetical protein
MRDEDEDIEGEDDEEEEREEPGLGLISEPTETDGVGLGEPDAWDILAAKFDDLAELFATGLAYVKISRDFPVQDSRGKNIHGPIETFHNSVDFAFISARYGGGTYNAAIYGPPKSPEKGGKVCLGRVYKLQVAGDPKPNNGLLTTEEARTLQTQQKAESGGGIGIAVQAYERTIDEERRLRASAERERTLLMDKLAETRKAEGGTRDEMMRLLLDQKAGEAQQLSTMMREMVVALAPGRGNDAMQATVESIREGSERERRDLMERAAERERTLRDEHEKRERLLRDAAEAREQTLRDEFERREKGLRDIAGQEASRLREQLAEVKERLHDAEARLEGAKGEAASARYDALRAQMLAESKTANHKPFTEQMQEYAAMADMLGYTKGGPAAEGLEKYLPLLNSEPARRVSAGFQNLLTAVGQRAMQQQQPPPPPPPQDALVAWQQSQQARRPRRLRRAEAAEPAEQIQAPVEVPQVAAPPAAVPVAEGAAQWPVPQVEPGVPVPTQDEMVASAKGMCQLLEAAASAGKTPGEFLTEIKQVITALGADPEQLHGADPDEVVVWLEGLTGEPISYAAKKLLRAAVSLA